MVCVERRLALPNGLETPKSARKALPSASRRTLRCQCGGGGCVMVSVGKETKE